MKKLWVWTLGVLCILVGIAGLILPGLQGTPFIFLGLSLIAPRFAARLKRQLFRRFLKSDWVYLEEWKKSIGVQAGFTTRHFPLKLSRTSDLAEPGVFERFTRSHAASRVTLNHRLAPIERGVLLDQVHGADVAVLDEAGAYEKPGLYRAGAFDAAVTNIPGLTLLVFSADCLSIFFVAGDWVGLAHAGWRGTHGQIAVKTLKILSERSGLPASEIRVIFGPCISAKYYEVGEEFEGYFSGPVLPKIGPSLRRVKGRLHFDLIVENERQLLTAGVSQKYISDHGICTYAEARSFYSFRREGKDAGRMISFITRNICSERS